MGTESVELNNSIITILHSHISILFTKHVHISMLLELCWGCEAILTSSATTLHCQPLTSAHCETLLPVLLQPWQFSGCSERGVQMEPSAH